MGALSNIGASPPCDRRPLPLRRIAILEKVTCPLLEILGNKDSKRQVVPFVRWDVNFVRWDVNFVRWVRFQRGCLCSCLFRSFQLLFFLGYL